MVENKDKCQLRQLGLIARERLEARRQSRVLYLKLITAQRLARRKQQK